MFTRLISVTLVAFLSITGAPGLLYSGPVVRRVVVVSVDGARPDALSATRTPTISRLWKRGAYSFRAQTIFPPQTLPSHASMLTGLSPKRHGMFKNTWKPGKATIRVETVFSLAHSHHLKTAMVVAKPKLAFLKKSDSPRHVKIISALAPEVASWAAWVLHAKRPHLLFVHFSDPDLEGHLHGWMSPQYFDALSRVDRGVGILVRALEQNELLSETVLILTADHGGHSQTHSTGLPQDMTIPWIALGPGIREGYEILDDIVTTDTAATILYILNLPIPDGWEGRPLRSIFK